MFVSRSLRLYDCLGKEACGEKGSTMALDHRIEKKHGLLRKLREGKRLLVLAVGVLALGFLGACTDREPARGNSINGGQKNADKNQSQSKAVTDKENPKKYDKKTFTDEEIKAALSDRTKWQDAKNIGLMNASILWVEKKLGDDYQLIKENGKLTKKYTCAGIDHYIATFRHLKSGLLLNLIPGGKFNMGSNSGSSNEKPVHEVTIKPILIGRHEVRQSAWDKVGGTDTRSFKGPDLPIESTSWDDAQAWLKKAGGGLRLPSESEWEYACRGGSTTVYYWGDTMDDSYCWYKKNCWDLGKKTTQSVTSHFVTKKWNSFGLVDMSGNVYEWCQDWYIENYGRTPRDSKAFFGKGALRVYRGGGWFFNAPNYRSAVRATTMSYTRSYDAGFRVVRTLDDSD
ncbi:MAG: formylglycine-generating enzyme family protein [Planctomycetota bacterium]|nr:formylglycine-generating enzyme family protein [Planctomycetota bacterium]